MLLLDRVGKEHFARVVAEDPDDTRGEAFNGWESREVGGHGSEAFR